MLGEGTRSRSSQGIPAKAGPGRERKGGFAGRTPGARVFVVKPLIRTKHLLGQRNRGAKKRESSLRRCSGLGRRFDFLGEYRANRLVELLFGVLQCRGRPNLQFDDQLIVSPVHEDRGVSGSKGTQQRQDSNAL